MRILVLVGFLHGLVINVFAKPFFNIPSIDVPKVNVSNIELPKPELPKVDILGTLATVAPFLNVSQEELDLFNVEGGLCVFDDFGNIVQATLHYPFELDAIALNMDTHVIFHLYTREIGNNSEVIKLDDVDALLKTNFDPTRPTKFIAHGWMNSKDSRASQLIKEAFLKMGDYNVIVVDWSKIAKRPYVWAAVHVLDVGKHVAKLINFLEDQGIDLKTTTLSGHSLGAHVMGLGGFYARNKVNYIVGLDPALPLFALASTSYRISVEAGRNVEIIHTNAGLLGYLAPIGQADFYPNGGKKQVGCAMDLGGACSHARSYEFFAESIVSEVGFYGMKCKDYSSYQKGDCEGEVGMMGGPKSELVHNGIYYLETGSNYPYAKGKAVLFKAQDDSRNTTN